MKVQITAITPHGTFVSDPGPDITKEQVDALENMLANCNSLAYLTIVNEQGTHYIPGSVVKDSIIVLKVEGDDIKSKT